MAFNAWTLGHEPIDRLGAFFAMFALMGVWEALTLRALVAFLPRLARRLQRASNH